MFLELYLTNHGPWPPGSLILTVVIAGPAGIGSNYPEGAPPEALLPWADLMVKKRDWTGALQPKRE
jgi:hypothetical protein